MFLLQRYAQRPSHPTLPFGDRGLLGFRACAPLQHCVTGPTFLHACPFWDLYYLAHSKGGCRARLQLEVTRLCLVAATGWVVRRVTDARFQRASPAKRPPLAPLTRRRRAACVRRQQRPRVRPTRGPACTPAPRAPRSWPPCGRDHDVFENRRGRGHLVLPKVLVPAPRHVAMPRSGLHAAGQAASSAAVGRHAAHHGAKHAARS